MRRSSTLTNLKEENVKNKIKMRILILQLCKENDNIYKKVNENNNIHINIIQSKRTMLIMQQTIIKIIINDIINNENNKQ